MHGGLLRLILGPKRSLLASFISSRAVATMLYRQGGHLEATDSKCFDKYGLLPWSQPLSASFGISLGFMNKNGELVLGLQPSLLESPFFCLCPF